MTLSVEMNPRVERNLHRRSALRTIGLLVLAAPALLTLPGGRAVAADEKPRAKILFYTRSQTFEHSAIKRKGSDLGHSEKVLTDLGAKHGFDVTCTKDGGLFTAENIAKFDAFFFYTTGDVTKPGGDGQPPMPAEGKKLFLDAIAGGKGFLGSHCATDTFHIAGQDAFENQPEDKRDPFIRMIGGEFIRHGPQQEAAMLVSGPKFPGCSDLGESFRINDEWYSMRNFAPDIHVILVQETKGMDGSDYKRPPFPATWARMHGKGRVFYTSMGHREDVWTNPKFQQILLGGIDWALGRTQAELTPNLAKAAPEASTMPPKPEPRKKKN